MSPFRCSSRLPHAAPVFFFPLAVARRGRPVWLITRPSPSSAVMVLTPVKDTRVINIRTPHICPVSRGTAPSARVPVRFHIVVPGTRLTFPSSSSRSFYLRLLHAAFCTFTLNKHGPPLTSAARAWSTPLCRGPFIDASDRFSIAYLLSSHGKGTDSLPLKQLQSKRLTG